MLVAACAVLAGSAAAQTAGELVKAKGCLNCHAAETTRIGPSFRDIAARHQADAAAADRLVETLRAGRRHPRIAATDAELRTIVAHVLGTK